ncbi:MAG: hypothetical protein R3208_09230 [Ketobacteraceae bacterium]|nr:hypothetical protein [Ketobacteraceae bacterium]
MELDSNDLAEENRTRRGIAQLALKGFFSIAKRWRLNRPQAMNLLGLTATSTYANWKNCKTSTIPRDTIERISYLLKIDETLKHIFVSDEAVIDWLNSENYDVKLNGCTPLDKMLQGNVVDLYLVYQLMPGLLDQHDFSSRSPESRRPSFTRLN